MYYMIYKFLLLPEINISNQKNIKIHKNFFYSRKLTSQIIYFVWLLCTSNIVLYTRTLYIKIKKKFKFKLKIKILFFVYQGI